MTEPAPEVPPYVRPYLPDFRDLWRQLDLVPGFIFQPVVLPSPDLARALADWLAAQGVAVRVFDMRSEPWDDLAVRLRTLTFDPPAERRAVVVITPSHLDRAGIAAGLAAVNFSRDSIAEHLSCPLLWCGDIELLRTTAELATDLWSIAATVFRIPLRALSDAPPGLTQGWWTGAVCESVESLAARMEDARRRGDMRGAVQASLELAEAQLARGDRSEALRTLAAAEPLIRAHAVSLWPRWDLLKAFAAGSAADAIVDLKARIADARARGAVAVAATLHEDLATAHERGLQRDEAVDALLTARALYHSAGDETAALIVAQRLVVSYAALLPPDILAELHARARDHSRAPTRRHRALGWGILAWLAYHQQRWDEADEAAAALLRELDPQDFRRPWGLGIRTEIATRRGDWSAAATHVTELLEYALAHDMLGLAARTYRDLAAIHFNLGREKDTCRGLVAARALAHRLGDHAFEAELALNLAGAALHHGDPAVHAALLPRALASLLRAESALPPDVVADVRDDELARLLAARGDDPAGDDELLAGLDALADARERALGARGIDLSDVASWSPVASGRAANPTK